MMNPDKNDLSFHSSHRQRLRQKFLDNKLADYELLELVLSFVIPRRDVRPLAHGLIKRFGGIAPVLTAPFSELTNFPGIGHNTAIFIKAIHQIMLNGYKYELTERPIFHNEKVLTNYCLMLLSGKSKEEFHVFYLDAEKRLIADDLHSTGTNDWAAIYEREILRRALEVGAKSVVMLHNHPTPNTSFSTTDIEMTNRIINLLQPFDISVYDHYLVSGGIVYSARNMFLIK